TVAFEIGRQRYSLHGAGGGRLEPLVVEDAFTFDSDQAGANVRRSNADFDRVAAAIRRLVELHLQFGVAFERTRQVGLAGDGVAQSIQFGARSVAQHQYEIAG